jgi:hypothetical protein
MAAQIISHGELFSTMTVSGKCLDFPAKTRWERGVSPNEHKHLAKNVFIIDFLLPLPDHQGSDFYGRSRR